MERSRAVLITLVCVLLSRISGVEVEMIVRPGDNVVLHSDCVWKEGFNTVWFRNASNEQVVFHEEAHPRYSIVWNPFNRASDLLVRNVKPLNSSSLTHSRPPPPLSQTVASAGSCWSVCVLCVFSFPPPVWAASAVGRKHDSAEPSCENTKNPTSRRQDKCLQVGGDDVCYASLDHQNRGQKWLKKKRDQSSDFTTYSGVIYSGKT
ncbi:hypothetical protein SRHO_G00248360 [Serrasalmus rhombeus]